jgi:putative ABC transport system substrate-binding protein
MGSIVGTVPGLGEEMLRRDFCKGIIGLALVEPLVARAEQPALPVIGFLNPRAPTDAPQFTAAFRQGLKDLGFVEGQSVSIEYRFAGNQDDRLRAMAADLVDRKVAVIAAAPSQAVLAAKAATTTIPIVFEIGFDPVRLGLVASLSRPGGNLTGVTQLNEEVAPKRLEFLHELVPMATDMALLVNPAEPAVAENRTKVTMSAARALGLKLHVLNASNDRDFESVFARLIELRAGALVIGGGAFLIGRSKLLAQMALRHAVPAISEGRDFVAAGGLISYGGSITEAYRLVGVYTGRILKGERPADMPVEQATKVELYINLKTAKTLGITVPLPLSGRADELVE